MRDVSSGQDVLEAILPSHMSHLAHPSHKNWLAAQALGQAPEGSVGKDNLCSAILHCTSLECADVKCACRKS